MYAVADDSNTGLINWVNESIRQLPYHSHRDILKFLPLKPDIDLLVDSVESLLSFPLFNGNRLRRMLFCKALKTAPRFTESNGLDAQDNLDIAFFEARTGTSFHELLDLADPTSAMELLGVPDNELRFFTFVYLRLWQKLKPLPFAPSTTKPMMPPPLPRPSPQPVPQPLSAPPSPPTVSFDSEEGVPASAFKTPPTATTTATATVPTTVNKPAVAAVVPPAPKPTPTSMPLPIQQPLARCRERAVCAMGVECKLKHTQEEVSLFRIRDRAVEYGFAAEYVKTSICQHYETKRGCYRDKHLCFYAHGPKDQLCRECCSFGSCSCV